MKITSKKTNTSVEFTVLLDTDDLEPARLKALESLARDLKIPGFRNGKAPANIVEQHLNPNTLANETLNIAIRNIGSKVFESEKDLKPISMPHIEIAKYVPGEMAELTITADILPEVKLADYKKLGVEMGELDIKDGDVDDVLKRIAKNFADSKEVKRAAKMGDEVKIDFLGKKDGKAFEGGAAKDFPLVLGSGQFIPGFEEKLVGHKAGEKFDIELSFPEDYGNADLAGQKTVFEINLHAVHELEEPKIDDELAKKTGAFETLDALKADIRKNLEAQTRQQLEEKYRDDLLNALIDQSEVEAPLSLVEEQIENRKNDILRNLKTQGMELDDALKMSELTKEQWEEELRKSAVRRVQGSILIQAVADELKITVKPEDVDAEIAEMRERYKKDPELLKQLEQRAIRDQFENHLRIEAAFDELVKLNSAAPAKKASKKAAKKSEAKEDKKADAKAPAKKTCKKSSKKSEK